MKIQSFRKKDEYARWSVFKNLSPTEMYEAVSETAFPFIKNIGGDDSTYSKHMKDARFTIPNAGLLSRVVDMIDKITMADRDTKGDLYEYMLGKIATARQNGQYLRLKAFIGNSPNAVKTQLWIARCVYLLVAMMCKRLKLEMNMGEVLQILSVTIFEKMPISQDFSLDQHKIVQA